MLNNKNSLLSSGVFTWLKPSKLIEAVEGCLQVTAGTSFCLTDAGATGGVKMNNRAVGVVSIPLTNVSKNYRCWAGSGKLASKTIVAGDSTVGWRVFGLPDNLVLLSKSPDNSKGALVGSDFSEAVNSYVFYKNPLDFGVIATNGLEPVVSFYYLRNSGSFVNFKSVTSYDKGFSTQNEEGIVSNTKGVYLTVNGACGEINTAAAGLFSCSEPGELEAVWTEGDYKIGATKTEFLYAPSTFNTKNPGDALEPGDTLLSANQNTGSVIIKEGTGYWFNGGSDIVDSVKTTSIPVLKYATDSVRFSKFIESVRPNVACNPILQYFDITQSLSAPLSESKNPVISRIWVLYSSDDKAIPQIYPGLTTPELRAHCINNGGAFICSNIQSGYSEDGGDVLITLSMNSKTVGRQQRAGDTVYGVALEEAGTSKIYKLITIKNKQKLSAHATLVVRLFGSSGISAEDQETAGVVNDDLTVYWLKTVQDILID
jgi:hypothetical protein